MPKRNHSRAAAVAVLAVTLALVLAVDGQARADNIAAAGDIANAPASLQHADQATAALLNPSAGNGFGLVLTLGDNQYECGELANFLGAYDKTWGPYKTITRPAPGNHEYITPCSTPSPGANSEANEAAERPMSAAQAAGADYYTYFAGRTAPHPGYYSYNWQGWHFVVINTTFTVMTAAERAAQLAWFKADLAADHSKCQVVYGHHPYKATASPFTSTPDLAAYWPTMVLEDVDLYLSGHNHSYERGKPIRTQGNIDTTAGAGSGGDGHMGVRWVVAGLGGRSIVPFTGTPTPSSVFRYSGSYGVFKIVPNYPAAGGVVTAFKATNGSTQDRVSWGCH